MHFKCLGSGNVYEFYGKDAEDMKNHAGYEVLEEQAVTQAAFDDKEVPERKILTLNKKAT